MSVLGDHFQSDFNVYVVIQHLSLSIMAGLLQGDVLVLLSLFHQGAYVAVPDQHGSTLQHLLAQTGYQLILNPPRGVTLRFRDLFRYAVGKPPSGHQDDQIGVWQGQEVGTASILGVGQQRMSATTNLQLVVDRS